jgi:malate synthase
MIESTRAAQTADWPAGVDVTAPVSPAHRGILTPDALSFVADLQRRYNRRRLEVLAARCQRQAAFDAGEDPAFLAETADVRRSDWRVAPLPADLQDRRVEITGPVDRKMVINALNSGASCYMADFEDSHSPTWEATLEGQNNLRDAVNRTIEFEGDAGKRYSLNPHTASLLVRPRGWHLTEKHLLVDGQRMSASLFDFGLFLYHNARTLLASGAGPYFYLPKLQSHQEARLWNDVFVAAQKSLGLPVGTIRATVLIETILAAFEMDEILYELRDHAAGLNCGRWDYIFSFIKTFRRRPDRVLPDRAQVTMTTHFMRAYSLLAIQTCHRRGASAMGGMAAQIPIKNDPQANEQALTKVRADKRREAQDGHDGTWVAHPGLVAIAKQEFDAAMPSPNQIDRLRDDVTIAAADLLRPVEGTITEEGLRLNIRVGVQYLEAWLGGNGCVPLYNLMEDAATAEISRTQVWQWLHNGARLADGRTVSFEHFRQVFDEELDRIRAEVGEAHYRTGKFPAAAELFKQIIEQEELEEFLTLKAYEHLP